MANYHEDIVNIELESGNIHRSFLHHSIGAGDDRANRFGVRVFRNGEPENVSGSCFGLFIRADGATVAINNGTVSGNVAYVTLPDTCYAVEGQFCLTIKVSTSSDTTTLRIVDGVVSRTSTDAIVDPGTIIPSIEYLIEAIEDAVESIPPDYSELVKSVKIGAGINALELNFSAGYINAEDLSIVRTSTGDHLLSDAIQIPGGSLLYVPKVSKSSNTVLLCECDASGDPVFMILRGTTTINSNGEYLIVPVLYNTYFRFGGNTTMEEYMMYYRKDFDKDFVFESANYGEWMSYPTEIDYGPGPVTDSGVQSGDMYMHSSSFLLMKGMTIEVWSAGSSANVALSKYSGYGFTFIAPLVHSSGIDHFQYTATESMYVRVSARIYPPEDGFSPVCPPDYFYAWKIYNKELHTENVKASPLYGKKLTVMGDSLIHGDRLGNGVTWPTALGIKYNMTVTNLGINGNTVAVQTAETTNQPMVSRISSVPTNTEIFVLLGGANDKRLNVPIGTADSSDTSTFLGALNSIVSSMRDRCQKAKIIFMTTYNRYGSKNSLGFGDEDYANAMIEAGKHNLVPVFDNFHCSGVNFLDDDQRAWIDESRNLQKKVSDETVYDDDTHHFSLEGYEWITPLYEAALAAGTATPIIKPEGADQKEYIDELLANVTATDITSSNAYVEPHGKYATVNGVVYFKILFRNLQNVDSGTGSTPVANLPIPSGEAVFYETGRGKFIIGSRLEYDNLWKLYGKRTAGEYTLVYGSYTPAS